MVLLDFSQVAVSSAMAFKNDLRKTNTDRKQAVNIVRHAILSGVKYWKKRYAPKYGEVVIACDGRNYWRKGIFPYYKAGRKASRDASDFDWKLVLDTASEIRDDLRENFPYKVIHLDHVEGDDIIGTLCKWTQTNNTVDRGMFEEKQPVMIVSSDGDFKQLHKFDNVEQWSPIQKKKVVCDDPVRYLNGHIAKAGDDGIPNILSPDNVFVTEGIRQTKMMSARLEEFIELGRGACKDDAERVNWDRNETLINLERIPEPVQEEIVQAYINTTPTGSRMSIYNYLMKHRCNLLMNEIEEF